MMDLTHDDCCFADITGEVGPCTGEVLSTSVLDPEARDEYTLVRDYGLAVCDAHRATLYG